MPVVGILEPHAAKRRHDRRKLYTVLIGPIEHPSCFLEVNLELNYIGVQFLDRFLREFSCYQFTEIEPGRMFLKTATEWRFDRDAPRTYGKDGAQVILEITTKLKPEGWVDIWRHDIVKDFMERAEGPQDVSACWEPTPQFGDWASIARYDRDRSVEENWNPDGSISTF